MPKSAFLKHKLLQVMFEGGSPPVYTNLQLALYTGDPTPNGSGPEVSGGAYARQNLTFGAAVLNTKTTTADVVFPTATADWGTISHAAIWDDVGNMYYYGPVVTSIPAPIGTVITFPAGNVVITE